MTKPKLLDLFSGHQGTGVGFARAGFEVHSVDIEEHPRHPEIAAFSVADALDVLLDEDYLSEFAVVAAGPPCQGYTLMRNRKRHHPRLIGPVRERLVKWGGLYVIENVPGAREAMVNPVQVCGQSLGLGVRRHRLFESNLFLMGTPCVHRGTPVGVYGEHPDETVHRRPSGTSRGVRARSLEEGRAAMGIDWMSWEDLTEAIPPAYTQFVGEQLIDQLGR